MLTVEHYIEIRRRVEVEGESQRAVAKALGHSRKTVKKALEHAVPPGYRRAKAVHRPVLGRLTVVIEAWMEADKKRPRKQRHTAQRMYERLRDEHGFTGHVSTVRRFVAHLRKTTGDVYFPLQFDPGEEAQMDWGEAKVIVNGRERKVPFFAMRLCYSKASYVRVYERQQREMLLDGHVHAFEFFGGVPRRLAYDNMKVAVITVGKGQERRLTKKFVELRSHFLFETRFCNIASGNEKGDAENLVKYTQRTFFTPLPEVTSLDDLNRQLESACLADLDRVVERHGQTRRELLAEEQVRFLPLPQAPFLACIQESTQVNKQALVRFDTNDYSVPVCWARHAVVVRGYVEQVEVVREGEVIAVHERSYGRREFVIDPAHYLPLLEKKPAGIHNARAFRGQPWGPDFDLYRRELVYRYGDEAGMRAYVDVLLLFTQYEEAAVKAAVKACIQRRAYSADAVRAMLEYVPPRTVSRLDLSHRPELEAVGEGTRSLAIYDDVLLRGAPS